MFRLVNLLAALPSTSVSDPYANKLMEKLGDVVDMLTTVIYVVLGVFLVVKGALIGMQIVKAADEPQVRQEKIGSLKWLVIGVAIAYGVTFAADVLVGYLKNLF